MGLHGCENTWDGFVKHFSFHRNGGTEHRPFFKEINNFFIPIEIILPEKLEAWLKT